MSFHGITSKVHDRAPTRAPRQTEDAIAASEQGNRLDVEDHEFPSTYDWGSALPLAKERQLLPGLASLIDVACAEMGCTSEHTLALRMRALDEPEAVERFCLEVHEAHGNIPRLDPLIEVRSEHSVAFWIEGLAGKAVFCAPMTEALRPYDGQTLAIHDVIRSPFPNYGPKAFATAKLLPRNFGPRGFPHAGLAIHGGPVALVASHLPEQAAGSFDAPPNKRALLETAEAVHPLLNLGPSSLLGSDDEAWGLVDI